MLTNDQLNTQATDPAKASTYSGPDATPSPQNNAAGKSGAYSYLSGYVAAEDQKVGYSSPIPFAGIKPGDMVVELGSGAGDDCFMARAETGEIGRVIGIDLIPAMIERARQNAQKFGYTNVEFVQGDIEAVPLPGGVADVVMSNSVINLVPDKQQAFDEVYRILKPGGHCCLSDIVLVGTLPDLIREAATKYADCVSGAVQEQLYLDILEMAGFEAVRQLERRPVQLPDELLTAYLTDGELKAFRETGAGVFSVTVYAEKPNDALLNLSDDGLIKQREEPADEDDLDDLGSFDFLGRL